MAQLGEPATRWSRRQSLEQYAAIARLRWRMLVNISRRSDTAGEIAGRVVLYVLLSGFAVFLTLAAGGSAWLLVHQGQLPHLSAVLWVIFALCQFLNINLGQPGTAFDPTQLIRFPLRLPSYVAIRLFFNLLSPANVMAFFMSMAAGVGISLARPGLAVYALPACLIFALTIVLFSRMVFAWVDRWLSTRRARELFTAAIFAFSLGLQYVNFTFSPAYGHHVRHEKNHETRRQANVAMAGFKRAEPLLRYLPPSLTVRALVDAAEQRRGPFLGAVAGCAIYGALFLLVFALRMRVEFQGESLSDLVGTMSSGPPARPLLPVLETNSHAPRAALQGAPFWPPALWALLSKEWMYMRRNVGLLYGLITPLFLVVMAAVKWGRTVPAGWVVPAALLYSLLGIAPLSYNTFGLDGTGAQLYFMAPVPFRQVFLAKNLLHFGTVFLEVASVLGVAAYISAFPAPTMLLSLLLWIAGTVLLNTAVGNRRSISAPKKISLTRMAGKQASQTSSLLSLCVLLGCGAYGALILALADSFGLSGLVLPCFALLAGIGAWVYWRGLNSLQAYTLAHRDLLFEELGKS